MYSDLHQSMAATLTGCSGSIARPRAKEESDIVPVIVTSHAPRTGVAIAVSSERALRHRAAIYNLVLVRKCLRYFYFHNQYF
ncbi:hypothetical protein DPMN_003980 [Dreissena polymorpha]|uniref:Uncharacterized protein n=1 Tax=Dreissena polymorpha TaxID=45954 RepID=A0A9D4MMR8_DREPO|nr:hypothetical protein DPMN_003980 [Dreissena polymorpha]